MHARIVFYSSGNTKSIANLNYSKSTPNVQMIGCPVSCNSSIENVWNESRKTNACICCSNSKNNNCSKRILFTFIHSMQQKGDKKTSAWMRCIAFILTPVSSGAMRSIYLCTMNREYLFNGANYYYCSWTVRKIQFP